MYKLHLKFLLKILDAAYLQEHLETILEICINQHFSANILWSFFKEGLNRSKNVKN